MNALRTGHAALLLTGRVVHERLRPVRHAFAYPLFQICCDLDRLDTLASWWFGVDRWRVFALATRDYGPRDGSALAPWMRAQLSTVGIPADGPIWLQTIPRLFGHAFNPVSFWYCYDRAGSLRALYADVRNTFGAHHGYLLSAPEHAAIDAKTALVCRKVFHVSPFCRVEGEYAFRVIQRDRTLAVRIDYHDADGLLLRTALAMHAAPLTAPRAWAALLRAPANAANVLLRIHWQALRLWLKRVPFHGKAPGARAPLPHHEARP
ncbi:DUF1365 domain-containing protein [Paraburkholderia sp. Ac-20340]|uniref:DUF1365 domain-containing protein n=1 Tax=Paraburkholderia sp. Ac-20340 TaxID=2703888 RepID=UPI00197F2F2D|nr:DUF1365 domain-containing protein [Paraburkholderia sp. Ac-20340]MBN3856211.1 DUF1365 domain-containing protein [Paraburkholderia sp. Ac-20340]